MGKRKRRPAKPLRRTASELTTMMDCPLHFKLRYMDVYRPLPPKLPIMMAGGVVHDAARDLVARKGSWRLKRRVFYTTPEAFSRSVWGLWSRTVKKQEGKGGIRWRSDDPEQREKEFVGLASYMARVLSGYAWEDGPGGQRVFRQVQRGYYQMIDEPRIPFRVLAAERKIGVLFDPFGRDPFHLVGTMDLILMVEPCAEFPEGGVVIVDVTMGSDIKYVQLTEYSLIFRLALQQRPEFRELTGLGPGDREEAVAVLSLSKSKLYIFRRGEEDYENLTRWLAWVADVIVSKEFEPKPTDAVCGRCEYSYVCRFAATTEVLNLGEGGAYVVAPIEEPPPLRIVQTGFRGLQRGKGVQGTRTSPFVFPKPVLTLEGEAT